MPRDHQTGRAAAPSPQQATERSLSRQTWIPDLLYRHWPLALLVAVATVLVLANLGADHLWEDEGDTAVLAANILRHRLPVAWDGVTFVAPDYGQRLTRSFVMVSHPWLQYYAAAASFALFGETPWAARFPFALAGLATIVLVYVMTANLLRSRLAAISAAILLTLNVQFLLFSRQARNYSFHALLTCLLVWQFQRLRSRRDAAVLAGIGILLFHTHPIGLAAVAGLGLLTLVDRSFKDIRHCFWPAALAVGIYATPWLIVSQAGYERNLMPLEEAGVFLPRLLQFVIESASVTPLVGLTALVLIVSFRRRVSGRKLRRRIRAGLLSVEERSLAAACLAVVAGESLVMAATHSRTSMWIEGLHQTPAIIPLVMILAGWLITRVSGSRRGVWIALMLVFGFTRFAQATPWAITPPRQPGRHCPHQRIPESERRARRCRRDELRLGAALFPHPPSAGNQGGLVVSDLRRRSRGPVA